MSEETRIVIDMALLLLISGVFSLIFAKIKMPSILGYLTAGIILGPTMLPELWVEGSTVVLLSSIGIVLLMFYIGLETDMSKLRKNGSKLIFIVCLQMPIVVAIGYLAGILLGMDFVQSIFLGAIISGTSTAVVVGVLKESRHIDGDTAKTIITITIFEDVGQVIIMTMAAPMLAGDAPAFGSTVNMVIGLILFVGLTLAFGTALIPRALNYIGNRFSAEILLIVSAGLCFAMATISMIIGLSIAIGAFIMGMMISMSFHRDEISKKIEPVKELFMAIFFISIGLQISPALILDNLGLAVIIAVVFIASKIGSVTLGCYIANMTARESLVIAMSLVAMGEFAFIIGKLALDAGVVTLNFYSAVIGAAVITMVTLPIMTKAQPKILEALAHHLPKHVRSSIKRIDTIRSSTTHHTLWASEPGRLVQRGVSLIFVDCMVIVLVMLVFNAVGRFQSAFTSFASSLHILPQELLILALVLVVIPAIYNIHYHVKMIAGALTEMAARSPHFHKGNTKHVNSIFLNLGYIAMFLVVLALIVPFIPGNIIVSTTGLIIALASAFIILYLTWDTIRRGYDRFFIIMTKNSGRKDDQKEGG
ncbi:MAG: cation:proton antiporter [Methanomassiliicoccales archaeon]|nr:cation:proton antiporter [Methanomassiliicoccales archaeon]